MRLQSELWSCSGLEDRDKDEGTVVVAVTAALCLGLKPSVQYLFWGVQDPVQWDTVVQKTETKMKVPAVVAVTTALCPGSRPSDNIYSEESSP